MSKRKNSETIDKENLIESAEIGLADSIETVDKVSETLMDEMKAPVVEDAIKSCKVIKVISNDKAIIDFDGFGLIVDCSPDKKFIDIKYSGNIGKADFRYEAI